MMNQRHVFTILVALSVRLLNTNCSPELLQSVKNIGQKNDQLKNIKEGTQTTQPSSSTSSTTTKPVTSQPSKGRKQVLTAKPLENSDNFKTLNDSDFIKLYSIRLKPLV